MGLTIEQERALALAKARKRAKEKAAASTSEGFDLGKMVAQAITGIGDAGTAFQAGANQGMTFGFGDELAAGMLAPITAIKPALEGKGYDLGKAYGENLDFVRGRVEQDRAKNPIAAFGGDVTGAAIPLAAAGATQLGGRLLGMTGGLPSRIAMGGASGGVIGAADTVGRGGGLDDIYETAKTGAAVGAGLPIVGNLARGVMRSATGKALDPAETALARAIDADHIPVADIPARLAALGPGAVMADLGPNLQRQAGALASLPGEAQTMVRQSLMDRASGTNSRIIADTDAILGPAPIPSREAAAIEANRALLSPEYRAVFQNNARAVDTTALADDIDAAIVNLRGEAQTALRRVRPMLDIHGVPGTLDPNPETLFQTRQAIDGLLQTEQNDKVIAALTNVRRQVDDLLAQAVPGIKEVDAKFAELARQRDALTTGQQLLDSGRTAVRPAELDTMLQEGALPQGQMVGPSAVPLRLSQGARAEIERIIGTTANNLTALKTALKGDGSWNRERLALLFGQDRADRLLQVLEREQTFDSTNRIVTQNSETAARQAAQAEMNGGTPQVMHSLTLTGLVGAGMQKLANVGAKTRRASTNAAIAQALMGNQIDPVTATAVSRALARRSKPAAFAPSNVALALTGPGD